MQTPSSSQDQNQKKNQTPTMSGMPNSSTSSSSSMPGTTAPTTAAPQKGGFFTDETGAWTTTGIIVGILHFILAWFAIYLAYKCQNGFFDYLFACCCPYVYIPWVYLVRGDKSLCGIRSVVKGGQQGMKQVKVSGQGLKAGRK